jgi:hypothetical protein
MIKKSNKPLEKEMDYKDLALFEKKIATIEEKVVDLTAPNDLLNINEFNDLIKQVDSNHNAIYLFVCDQRKTDQQKEIAIYALRDLDFVKYLDFFEKCLLLYQKKQLPDIVIMTILCPGSNWNCTIVENYKDKNVKRLLKDNFNGMSVEMKEVFNNTLSGELWASIENERTWNHGK